MLQNAGRMAVVLQNAGPTIGWEVGYIMEFVGEPQAPSVRSEGTTKRQQLQRYPSLSEHAHWEFRKKILLT